jgi:flagellar protein FliO/FliZ
MMARFLFAVALAACLAGGAADARQVSSAEPAAALTAKQDGVRSAGPDPAPVRAASPAATQPVTSGSAAGSLLQTISALCLVLGLLGLLAWFLKRYGPKAAAGSANVRLVGALNLGGRERIMVVEVGDQWIVVGASPGRVNALATMPRREGAETAALLHPHQPPASSFSDWLKQTIDKRNAK